MTVNLSADESGFWFQRDIWTRRFTRNEKRYRESGDRAAYLPLLKRMTTSELEGMISLESTQEVRFRAGAQGQIRQDRPHLVLMDVKPGGTAAPDFRPVRVENLDDYPAPSWKLKVENWPSTDKKTPARAEAWWSDKGEPDKTYAAVIPLEAFNPDGVNQYFKVAPGSLAEQLQRLDAAALDADLEEVAGRLGGGGRFQYRRGRAGLASHLGHEVAVDLGTVEVSGQPHTNLTTSASAKHRPRRVSRTVVPSSSRSPSAAYTAAAGPVRPAVGVYRSG